MAAGSVQITNCHVHTFTDDQTGPLSALAGPGARRNSASPARAEVAYGRLSRFRAERRRCASAVKWSQAVRAEICRCAGRQPPKSEWGLPAFA
jgi:hypothetical protein